MTIIDLESAVEKDYSWFLSELITETKESNDQEAIERIRSFWDNEYSWEDILKMSSYEDNRWYVWWMDGVRRYLKYEQEQVVAKEEKKVLCNKCGVPRTDSWSTFLNDPNVTCFAHKGDSQATRFCMERQISLLLSSARKGWDSALVLALASGSRRTEVTAVEALRALDSMEEKEPS